MRKGNSMNNSFQEELAIRPDLQAKYMLLEQKLLAYGGKRMNVDFEPHLNQLLSHGQMFDGYSVVKRGRDCRCHENVARTWLKCF